MTVTVAAVVAALVLLGATVPALAVLLVVAWPPLGLIAGAGALAHARLRRRRATINPHDEAHFLRRLAAAVSAGEGVRAALVHAPPPIADATVTRLCSTGASMDAVGRRLRQRMPLTGTSLAAVLAVSDITGAGIVAALHTLVALAESAGADARALRVASAQAKFSAIVVGIAPLAIASLFVLTRGVPEPGGIWVVGPMVAGATLMVTGAVAVGVIAGRAAP